MTFAPGATLTGLNQIEQWRAQLAPGTFRPLHTVSYEFNLDPGKQTKACGGSWKAIRTPDDTPATPFRITFEKVNSRITSYEGDGYACTFTFPDPQNHFGQSSFATTRTEPVRGLIRYGDGSYWLGQVVGTRAQAITRGDVPVFGVLMFLPTPRGIGEWGLPDGTRLQGDAVLKPDASTGFADGLQSGATPHGLLPDMPRVARAILPDGSVAIGDLQWVGSGGLQASNATIVREDGLVYSGRMAGSVPVEGTLRYPDGSSITGQLETRPGSTAMHWRPDLVVRTVAESERLGPPGNYRVTYLHSDASALLFGAPLQPERANGAAPLDAETIAKPTRNTRNCHVPPVVPPGWVIWWPSCMPGDEGVTVVYRPDMQQNLMQRFSGGKPSTSTLNIPSESRQIVSSSGFSAGHMPSPIGEAKQFTTDGLAFEGIFDGQLPASGFCAAPVDEGGGLEPCEFRSGHRVDELYHLRQQRIAMKREQEDLLRQQRRLQQEMADEQHRMENERIAAEQEARRLAKAAEDEEIDEANQVDWGEVMGHISNTVQRSADELNASARASAHRMEQARRADEAYQARQQRAAELQTRLEALQQQSRMQQTNAANRSSMPAPTADEASDDGSASQASGTTTADRYARFAEESRRQTESITKCLAEQSAWNRANHNEFICTSGGGSCAAEKAEVERTHGAMVSAGCANTGGSGVRGDP